MTRFSNAALLNHVAILGKTGSGKTSTAKLLVEQVVDDGARVCILDPVKSDWWGLISSADGKRPGLPFQILGGPRGHVPLHSSAGRAVGELVGSGKLPLSIVDMADFEPGGLQRFFVDFAGALMKSARGVVYLVIEEAHEFAPKERSGIGAENLSIHWAKKLATAGRSKGVRLVVATQRTQALHNAVLGSCETLITHRLTAPADQAPVVKWLRANTDKPTATKVEESLSSLKTGTGWVCSGEEQAFERVRFDKFRTFDNSKTPDGDAGDSAIKTAAVDVEALRTLIGDAVKDAEENDPKKLKAQIAELKRAAATAPAGPAPEEIESRERIAYARGWADKARAAREAFAALVERQCQESLALRDVVHDLATKHHAEYAAAIGALQDPPPAHGQAIVPPPGIVRQPTSKPPQVFDRSAAGTAKPVGPERRPLQVLVDRYPAGFTEAQWATLAGMKRSGGTWSTYKSRLKQADLIEPRDGLWFATGDAVASIGRDIPHQDPISMWKNALGAGPARIIDALAPRGASPTARSELAELVNMAEGGGTFSTYLSKLKSNGVIEKVGDGFRLTSVMLERS